jgi:hypothetical protein
VAGDQVDEEGDPALFAEAAWFSSDIVLLKAAMRSFSAFALRSAMATPADVPELIPADI